MGRAALDSRGRGLGDKEMGGPRAVTDSTNRPLATPMVRHRHARHHAKGFSS